MLFFQYDDISNLNQNFETELLIEIYVQRNSPLNHNSLVNYSEKNSILYTSILLSVYMYLFI